MDPLSSGPTSLCVMLFCWQEVRCVKCMFFGGWGCCLGGNLVLVFLFGWFFWFMLLCVNGASDCESMAKDLYSWAVFCLDKLNGDYVGWSLCMTTNGSCMWVCASFNFSENMCWFMYTWFSIGQLYKNTWSDLYTLPRNLDFHCS